MEWFEKLLTDSGGDAEKLMASFKSEFPKHAVPKDQYNKKTEANELLTSELKTSKEQLESTTKKIAEMSSIVGENEELKTKFEGATNELTEYKSGEETRTARIKKASAVEKQLILSGANTDALEMLTTKFDLDKITITESGALDGFTSQFDDVKKNKASLFSVVSDDSQPPVVSDGDAVVKDDNFDQAMELILR